MTATTTGYQRGPPPATPCGTDVAAWTTPLKMSDTSENSAPPKEGMFPSAVSWGCHYQQRFTSFGGEGSQQHTMDQPFSIQILVQFTE